MNTAYRLTVEEAPAQEVERALHKGLGEFNEACKEGMSMEYDADKVDDMVLALLYLNMFHMDHVLRAWKGLDWDAMNRLYEKGYIGDPKSKAKSVPVTEEGYRRAKELFERCFAHAEESR